MIENDNFNNSQSRLKFNRISSGLVKKMFNGGIDNVLKFLNVTKEELLEIDGIQEKSANNILESIKNGMKDLDCIEAINLDGGGSSAMVVDGKLLNRPSGTSSQREVMSAIAVSLNE